MHIIRDVWTKSSWQATQHGERILSKLVKKEKLGIKIVKKEKIGDKNINILTSRVAKQGKIHKFFKNLEVTYVKLICWCKIKKKSLE